MKNVLPYVVAIVYLVGLVVLTLAGAATAPFITFAVVGALVSALFLLITVAVQLQEKVSTSFDKAFNNHPSNRF